MTSFPHVAAVRSRFDGKVQTTLMNNADNGLLWARWSASSTAVARMVCVLAEVLVAGPFYWRC